MKDNYGDSKGQKLIKKATAAFSSNERQNVEDLWAELSEFILPVQNRKWFGNKSKGYRNDYRLFDSVAQAACRDLSAAMQSTITNPASKWSKLRFKEANLNELDEGMQWLDHATSTIHNELTESNFDNQMGACYQSLCALGTGVLFHDTQNDENGNYVGLNFTSIHLSEVAYSENRFGIVDCLYRKFQLTVRQAHEMFGDAIFSDGSPEIKNKLDTKPDEPLDFFMCIYPRDKSEVDVNPVTGEAHPEKRPYACCYVMAKGNRIVKEDGYYEFPAYAMRWLTLPGEVYGYGPGHVARGDVLTLNVIRRQILKGLAKAIDPIIFAERQNILTGDMRPGKIVSVEDINGIKEAVTQSRFDVGFIVAEQLVNAIKSAFYIDKLMLPPRTETGEMTAYEIQQRLEQMQVILGPPLSRLNTELLDPLEMRTLGILMRAGKIDPIPDSVLQQSKSYQETGQSIDFEVAYVNSLARSQQLAELRNISAWVQEVGNMAQIKPEVLDRVNGDAIAKKMARIRDIGEDLIASDKQVAAAQQARQQQMQASQGLQEAESASNIVSNLSKGNKGIS